MRMGNKTNVSADGSALKLQLAGPPLRSPAAAPAKASAEDLEAEESGGLPVPKRHTLSEGTTDTVPSRAQGQRAART